MQQTDGQARQPRAHRCPEWCEQQHLGKARDVGGFHHDGPQVTVALSRSVASPEAYQLFVGVSQHVERGHASEPAYVEVQDERATLALLSPAECLRLSVALLDAAAVLVGEASVEAAQLEEELEDLELAFTTDWRPVIAARSAGERAR